MSKTMRPPLVEALANAAPGPSAAARPSPRAVGLLVMAVLAFAIGGYLITGTPDYAERQARAAQDAPEDPHASAGMPDGQQLEAMIGKLLARLESQPEDVDGWLMLGRVRTAQRRFDDALAAYARAETLRPDDVRRLVDQADLLGAKNHSLAGQPAAMIERALKIEPDHPKALALAGTVAFDAGDFALAVRHWERLLAVTEAEPAWQAQVRGSIAEARRLGRLPAGQAAAPGVAAAPPADSPPALSGEVAIAGSLAGRTAPEDTLFIYARAAQGSRMPLVILRKQVKDLPLQFRLDDSMAMSAAARLATSGPVVITARVSKSGQAMPRSGDLVGESRAVAVGSANLRIVIDQVLP